MGLDRFQRLEDQRRAAFRAERYARGSRNDHETCALITSVVQRIEAAIDEWIIERPDRQKALTKELM